ncbi:endonuclease/exonuclease/phosphatase family protein [Autumnicola edwardsiae]|jgi:endonuclease/exonuclease/phosphatase (EEP) superfamily protein YafD|uniref:Endonuclease/exonuclease/phosphatase family protein n=2 Tax=Pseudomonadati TaxID=3379134 RepID=A0ABU3CS58_9FLAO|nr:endonuclease/exonuclease/phosphatase family protein [Zunongwangia sp. F297]MDT0649190.1 endonuclease/exonuclease/phosphatase family protein [Zunongwangia sp. F297]
MTFPEILAILFGVLALIPTIASLTTFDQWWVRGFDFPRLQISVFILAVISYSLYIYSFEDTWEIIITSLLFFSFIYQAIKIYPYTVFARKQVVKSLPNDENNLISILVSNVLTSNKNYHLLISHIRDLEPDIVLTLESDEVWEKELEVIEKDYPHTIKIPQDNLYGMHLYSRLELEEIEVKYIISEEIPSIHGWVRLRSGKRVKIHCLHPKPPSPSEDPNSTNRDAELLLVGREVKGNDQTTLVFGDLNDVAWSRTTRLFQNLSGLLDPRIGRGFYNTFHTGYPVFRWPLDHVFHTADFSLITIKRLKSVGSDHFPIFIRLSYESYAEDVQEKPERADEEEKEWAEEKIEKANPMVRNL